MGKELEILVENGALLILAPGAIAPLTPPPAPALSEDSGVLHLKLHTAHSAV